MSSSLSPYVFLQELDNDGEPLAAGKIYTYEAGTTTPKTTYTDSTGAVANANPVVLDSAGRAQIWLGDGGYKFVLKASDDTTIKTVDNVGGTTDTAFAGLVHALTSNTQITTVYQNSALLCTGTFTLSLLPAAEAGEGFYFIVKNQGTGTITIDPNASELVDGATTASIWPQGSAVFVCSGTAWHAAIDNRTAGGFSTGDTKTTWKTTADPGWVMADDGTIGNASSGATTRANADTENLFVLLWYNNSYVDVSGGRGASAAADYAANKTIELPKYQCKARGVSGAGSGLTPRALGQTVGSETHQLTSGEMPQHNHSVNDPTHTHGVPSQGGDAANGAIAQNIDKVTGYYVQTTAAATGITIGNAGGNEAHNNMQPTIFENVMIKL